MPEHVQKIESIDVLGDVTLTTPTNGQVLSYDAVSSQWKNTSSGAAASDATTTTKGIVQLAGDLSGTAIAPLLATITTASTVGSASLIPVITYDAKGRITSTTTVANTSSVADATTTSKGIVQLAGGLAGAGSTAALPVLAGVQKVFNVRDYGAKGDGVTDDTAAINAAITAATTAGGRVYLPSSTYIFSAVLNLVTNVYIIGDGPSSILRLKAGVNLNNVIAGNAINNAGLSNLQVDYNHQNNTTSTNGMSIQASSYITIKHCTFNNCKGFAIGLTGTPTSRNNHCTIIDNAIINPLSSPNDLLLVVSDYGIVVNNRVIGANANIAIALYESTHLIAYGNEVELGTASTGSGIALFSLNYSQVYGNKVTGPGTANGTAYSISTEHDNASPVSSQRNEFFGNAAYNVGTALQLLETNYDRIFDNRFEFAGNGFQFPTSANPQAANLEIFDNYLLNVTTAVSNPGGASTNLNFRNNYGYVGNKDSALDTAAVHLSGTETISGAKTFSAPTTTISGNLSFNAATTISNASSYLLFSSADNMYLRSAGGRPVTINDNNTNGVILAGSGGNVGIGNTAPAYILDVTGTTRATSLISTNLQITGGTPALNKVLTSDATGNATWQTPAGGGGSSPATTKGDLAGFSTVSARVPVGANGTVLTGDSTSALGVSYTYLGSSSAYNYVVNPSFEVDYTGWSTYGGFTTQARDNTTAFSGTWSSKLYNSTVNDGGIISASQFSLGAGTYTFSVYAKLDATVTNACMILRGTEGLKVQINQTYPGNTNWNRYTATFTLTGTGTYEILLGQGSYAGASAGTVYYDAVQVEVGSSATTYFDGSSIASGGVTYSWTGTANASSSRKATSAPLTSTDYLLEGTTNQYFSSARAVTAINGATISPSTMNAAVTYSTVIRGGIRTISAATTLGYDRYIFANSAAAAFTLTLPNANQYSGGEITIKQTNTSANSVTVAASSSQLIDGASTYVLSGTALPTVRLVSDGSAWWII
jgi:hypothetical protein